LLLLYDHCLRKKVIAFTLKEIESMSDLLSASYPSVKATMAWESKTDAGPLFLAMEDKKMSFLQNCKPAVAWILTIAETEAHRAVPRSL
jgi:hypothetical protein